MKGIVEKLLFYFLQKNKNKIIKNSCIDFKEGNEKFPLSFQLLQTKEVEKNKK